MGDILDERNLMNNSTRFEYYEIKPDLGIDLNDTRTYTITSEALGRWEIPCRSYLDVEGQLLDSVITPPATEMGPYQPDAQGNYPDVTLTNNFFPFLFNNIKYKIDTHEVEVLDTPGILTTADALLSYQRSFNGLDRGWALDTGDGGISIATSRRFSGTPGFMDSELTIATIGLADYQGIAAQISNRFVTYNSATLGIVPSRFTYCWCCSSTSRYFNWNE